MKIRVQQIHRVPPAYLVFWLFFNILRIFWKKAFALIFSTLSAPPTPVTFAALASHGLELLLHLLFDNALGNWAIPYFVRGRVAC